MIAVLQHWINQRAKYARRLVNILFTMRLVSNLDQVATPSSKKKLAILLSASAEDAKEMGNGVVSGLYCHDRTVMTAQ